MNATGYLLKTVSFAFWLQNAIQRSVETYLKDKGLPTTEAIGPRAI